MSLAAKLSTDVLVTTLVKISLKLRGIVVIPLVTIYLGTAAYGAYAQVFAVATLLGQVTLLGLDTGIVQFFQQYGEDRSVTYWTLASALLLTGTGSMLVVAAAAPLLATYTLGDRAFATTFLVGSALVPLTVWLRFGQGYLRATRRIKYYSLSDVAVVYGHIAAVAGTVLLTDFGIAGVLAVVVATRAVAVGGIHLAIVREVGVASPSLERFRYFLGYSVPTMGTDVARSTLTQADRLLVGAVLGATAVGVYSVAYQVAQGMLLYVRPLSITLFPEFSRLWAEERPRVRDLTITALRYFIALAVPTIGGLWLIGKSILNLLTTPDVAAEAAPLLVLLAIGILLQGVSEIYTELFYAADQTSVPLRIQGVAAIVNVALNALLLPTIGIQGAAIATIVTFALAAGTTAIAFQYWLPVVPPFRSVAAPIAATAIMTAAFWVVAPWWPLTLVLAPVVYGVAFVALGGVERGELAGLLHHVGG
ncbi:flippase [Salinarchaeum laminariae]|uniref:flippase n=1 Tax=Salinarchaeum laminariae TaxID=869888 RepID=UPI0020C0FB6D|nr:flippase [Salinarchaeum laminariae]